MKFLAGLTAQYVFVGLVLYVCSSLLTRKEAATFHVSLSNLLQTSTMMKGQSLLSFKVRG